jgi:hypothetical protein
MRLDEFFAKVPNVSKAILCGAPNIQGTYISYKDVQILCTFFDLNFDQLKTLVKQNPNNDKSEEIVGLDKSSDRDSLHGTAEEEILDSAKASDKGVLRGSEDENSDEILSDTDSLDGTEDEEMQSSDEDILRGILDSECEAILDSKRSSDGDGVDGTEEAIDGDRSIHFSTLPFDLETSYGMRERESFFTEGTNRSFLPPWNPSCKLTKATNCEAHCVGINDGSGMFKCDNSDGFYTSQGHSS